MNATTQAIVAQLPRKPLLSPAEVAAAYGLKSTDIILADIRTGRLEANKAGKLYVISRTAAEAYIAANEYKPDEGTIRK